MKKLSIIILSLVAYAAIAAAQPKVAVFDPICDLPASTKNILREKVVGVIVSSPNYTAVERSLISKVMEESKFQAEGLVDETQQTELGRKAGANLVCIVMAVRLESDYYVSVKLVNLLTAQIEKQRTGQTAFSSVNVETLIQNLATEIFTKL
ncbi:MAG: hypothetical protein LBR26_04765 [Prevotella sp.]|jgi:hypothetical protein|nr:hypothetical protein [Prevotella sp.]